MADIVFEHFLLPSITTCSMAFCAFCLNFYLLGQTSGSFPPIPNMCMYNIKHLYDWTFLSSLC